MNWQNINLANDTVKKRKASLNTVNTWNTQAQFEAQLFTIINQGHSWKYLTTKLWGRLFLCVWHHVDLFPVISSPVIGHLLVTWWPLCSTPWSLSPPCCCCSSSSSLFSPYSACSSLGASSILTRLWPKGARLITSPKPCLLSSRWVL